MHIYNQHFLAKDLQCCQASKNIFRMPMKRPARRQVRMFSLIGCAIPIIYREDWSISSIGISRCFSFSSKN